MSSEQEDSWMELDEYNCIADNLFGCNLKVDCPTSVNTIQKLEKKEGKKPIKRLLPIVGQPPKTGLKPTDKGAKPPARSLNADPPNSMTVGVQSSKKRPASSFPPAPVNQAPPPGSLERSGSTGSVSHDLSKGSLYVDLSSDGCRVTMTSKSLSELSGTPFLSWDPSS
ncbi:hypothetical protein F2Q70_00032028 [Brassica cretica]|uniref:Uncharacterized protein n=1 Tax=Brassica cretica TaxID=69181 RepID=A0A8S9FC24_BRACR|nr:hypothetical protein F2Q70_00032028 [Brassica cretica]